MLELIGGLALTVVTKAQLSSWVELLMEHELSQDPGDRFARALIVFVQGLPLDAKLYATVYLLTHGLIKIFLVYNLLRERLWAFPWGMAFLGAFTLYQLYRMSHHFSNALLFFTALDIVIIAFIYNEYKLRKRGLVKDVFA